MMLEVIRRLGLLFCLLAAIATFAQTAPLLLEVGPVDFQKDYQASDATTEMTLDEYIAHTRRDIKSRCREQNGKRSSSG
jgi:hypothetical protein